MSIKDLMFFLINIILIGVVFFIKNKKKDGSFSSKVLILIKKEYPIIVFLIVFYFILNYIYLLQEGKNITTKVVYSLIWNQWCNSTQGFIKIIKQISTPIFQVEIFKIIIVGCFLIKILCSENLFEKIKYFISQIKELNFKSFSLKTQEATKELENKQNEIEHIKEQKSTGKLREEDSKEKIENIELEKEIIAIIIDNTKFAQYINSFINENSQGISIPKNLIPKKISLIAINKLFEYEVKHNSFRLLKIKEDKLAIVKKTFEELLEKGIIYCNIDDY